MEDMNKPKDEQQYNSVTLSNSSNLNNNPINGKNIVATVDIPLKATPDFINGVPQSKIQNNTLTSPVMELNPNIGQSIPKIDISKITPDFINGVPQIKNEGADIRDSQIENNVGIVPKITPDFINGVPQKKTQNNNLTSPIIELNPNIGQSLPDIDISKITPDFINGVPQKKVFSSISNDGIDNQNTLDNTSMENETLNLIPNFVEVIQPQNDNSAVNQSQQLVETNDYNNNPSDINDIHDMHDINDMHVVNNGIPQSEVIIDNIESNEISNTTSDNIIPIDLPNNIVSNKINNKKEDTMKNNLTSFGKIRTSKLKKINGKFTIKLAILIVLFISSIVINMFIVNSLLKSNSTETINYSENGNLDYRIYLKPNDFYETDYLQKGMYYIASIIKNINVDFDYQYLIDTEVDMNFSYSIIGNLKITDELEKNTFFEKEYTLLNKKEVNLKNSSSYNLKENLIIDYDYYNAIANNFKSIYGVDTASNLILYLKIEKNVQDEDRVLDNNYNELSVKIPLSQRALEIKIDDTAINRTKSISKEQKNEKNYIPMIIIAVLFIFSVAILLKLLELIFLLLPEKTKYEKYVSKILREYDRLIVETSTIPNFKDKNIIYISKIEELLDARDNLKMPIIYYKFSEGKCCFYIEKEDNIYLMSVDEDDLALLQNKK